MAPVATSVQHPAICCNDTTCSGGMQVEIGPFSARDVDNEKRFFIYQPISLYNEPLNIVSHVQVATKYIAMAHKLWLTFSLLPRY